MWLRIPLCIIELLGHCKCNNLNNHTWSWFGYFICLRREIRFYQFGKELLCCLSRANKRAFHDNTGRMYTKRSLFTLKAHITKSRMLLSSA